MIVDIEGIQYRILAIYAPNDNTQINFFTGLYNMIKNDTYDIETLMGGDYNCAQNPYMDRLNCISNQNDKGIIALRHLMHTLHLEDIWRIRNPDLKKYTWFGKSKASRIDYWLTSSSLNGQVRKIDSHHCPFSDHHGVTIAIKTNEIRPGKGVWKMNADHLLNETYKQEITEFWHNWQLKKPDFPNITQWWDIGKIKIKRLSRNFAIEQSIKNKSRLDELESEITSLSNSMSDNIRLVELKNQHNELLSKKTEGMKIRSRIQWWEEGEKSSRFFHSLEKSRGKNKNWDKIIGQDGSLVHGTENIQKEQVIFYKNLFTSQNINEDKSFFLSNPEARLSQNSKQELERDISIEEIGKAIKKMPNNKAPGEDGIIIEFYKLFFNLIGEDLLEVFRFGLEQEELAYSQYLALIILLYKKGPRENIKNWRPISLLNVDYKILSKILAERLKEVLHEIIHTDQKGCVKNRYIGENIRLIEDIIHNIENGNTDSIILLQDQEKAFDRVEWDWLFSTLRYFGFGEKFIGWLITLYKNAKSSIMTNGIQSAYFDITRGIRQGDSLSALLYIIQLEPLAQKIRNEPSFEGITVKLNNRNNHEIEIRGCQYVDDCNTFLKDKNCINSFSNILARYEQVSGSKINFDKTKAMAVNNLPGLPTERIHGIELITGPEKALGVPIGEKDKDNPDSWTCLIAKVKKKLDFWKLRKLSFQGKAHVIRSVGVSKLLYMLEMKTINDEYIKEINNLFWDFLWDGKNRKFSREICYLPRNMGGLNLVNIKIIEKVKRVNWILRFLKDDTSQPWTQLMENYIRCLDQRFAVSLFALKITDAEEVLRATDIPLFYKECLIYFAELLGIARVNLLEEFVWCSKKYRFNNKPINYSHWARKGMLRPSQLYHNGVLNKNKIFDKLTQRAGFCFEFQTIKHMFPERDNTFISANDEKNLENANKNDILNFIIRIPGRESKTLGKLTSKDIYNIFLHHKTPVNLSKSYWSNYAFPGHDFDWDTWYFYNFQNALTPRKSADYSWKIFYGLVETEATLKRWKKSNGQCKNCQSGAYENIGHLIIDCSYRSKIWTLISNLIQEVFGRTVIISRTEILTGYFKNDLDKNSCSLINMLLAMSRYSIWLSRNLIKHENKNIGFKEFYLSIKHYILSHTQILLLSSKTEDSVKVILEDIRTAVNSVFTNDRDENQIQPLT